MTYGNALKRIDKIKLTFEKLVQRNQELEDSNRKLRKQVETNLELYKANLRVKAPDQS